MSGTGQETYADTELAELYRAGMEENFSTLAGILEEIKNNPKDASRAMDQARSIVHNMKGQGTSFGFPLMTRVSDSFYELLKHQAQQNVLHISTPKLYEAHLKALQSILSNEISGEGPEIFQEVAASLKEKVAKIIQ